jgi:hypothetical protein
MLPNKTFRAFPWRRATLRYQARRTLFSGRETEMKAILILISNRGLRLDCGANFGGNRRNDQRRKRQER